MTVARLASRAARVPRGPEVILPGSQDGLRLVRDLRKGVDALPGSGDRLGPWPGGLDFQAAPPAAAGQPGGGVQQPGAQRLGLGAGQVAVQVSSFSHTSRICPVIAAVSQAALIAKSWKVL
jgi:hypothetical protein